MYTPRKIERLWRGRVGQVTPIVVSGRGHFDPIRRVSGQSGPEISREIGEAAMSAVVA